MYRQLEELLAAGKWREANRETRALLYKAAGEKDAYSWNSYAAIKKFPDTALSDIDHLWKKYSNNHFGFSVQKAIWNKLDSDTINPESTYSRFIEAIGWFGPGTYTCCDYYKYERYSNTSEKNSKVFSLEAPRGHLPMLQEWDLDFVDEHYHKSSYPIMIETMSTFFARIPHTEE